MEYKLPNLKEQVDISEEISKITERMNIVITERKDDIILTEIYDDIKRNPDLYNLETTIIERERIKDLIEKGLLYEQLVEKMGKLEGKKYENKRLRRKN